MAYLRPNTPAYYGKTRLPVFADIKDDLKALTKAQRFRERIGDESNAAWWEQKVGHPWDHKRGDIVYGKYQLGTRMPIQGPPASSFAKAYNLPSHEGVPFRELAKIDRAVWRDESAMMKRRIEELRGFQAAGGEEAYRAQQAERVAQAPQRQREAMRAAEQLRLRQGAASLLGGRGGGAATSPSRQSQRAAESERLTARGKTSTRGGGIARRRARGGASYLLQPTGGARELLG